MMRAATTLALMLACSVALADLPDHRPVPGGVAVVDLGPAGSNRPDATFQDRPVAVREHDGRWKAVVGIGLDATPGEASVRSGGDAFAFEITDRDYAEQRITLDDDEQVSPGEETLKRIRREQEEIHAARDTFSDGTPETMALTLPAEGRFSSPFGLRRYFNDQPRNPHSGLDIANETGTPIAAPLGGEVVETGDYFFNGKTVFVDHGNGFVTMYCHLDEIQVSTGDRVARGDTLGTIGATGRVTGPHLHWTVYLNGQAVDPLLFVEGEDESYNEANGQDG
ncbi:M23 family metallopeptidase [Aquisalimonas asiatica]|uniref:Murein DD-endopeptidase MepM and murein hydrolase activator NlpD, contain LysM domain n=1 Tax=Aquisalimonas asiatica TaxID=406100 RepID=A0A1H8PNV1_9GAMM|nr:M23 family metallopeptidase [Aquisalimonas asiatica]SEO43451.1 Murein DD-endopeptidase MepM and murein hydrolase activator NlpD, contain LysM domain [Aquisalimonas asiatica]